MEILTADETALVRLIEAHLPVTGKQCSCGQMFGGLEYQFDQWHRKHLARALLGQVTDSRIGYLDVQDVVRAIREAFHDTNPWNENKDFDWAIAAGIPDYIWERAAESLIEAGFQLTATQKAEAMQTAAALAEAIKFLDGLGSAQTGWNKT